MAPSALAVAYPISVATRDGGSPRAGASKAAARRARRAFHEQVLDWRFVPWGPSEFSQIQGPDGATPGPIGALQRRRTFDDGTAATVIAGVGELAFVADPSGTHRSG